MYQKGQEGIYYTHKQLLCIMYDTEEGYYKDCPYIYDIDVLKVFRNIVKGYCEDNCFSNEIKNNIYNILYDGRKKVDEYRDERIEIINDIIGILNLSTDNSINFYAYQLYYRTKNKDILKKYTKEDIEKEIPFILDSIENDFLVLISHADDVSDEEFKEEYLEDFIDNELYIGSLNIMLEECPSMFDNKIFIKRVKQVLDLCKVKDKSYKVINKVLKNKIHSK